MFFLMSAIVLRTWSEIWSALEPGAAKMPIATAGLLSSSERSAYSEAPSSIRATSRSRVTAPLRSVLTMMSPNSSSLCRRPCALIESCKLVLSGASPAPDKTNLQLSINAQGRLQSEEEFGDIIVKTERNGAVTRLRDVARIELGASEYALRSLLDNKPAVAIGIFAAPGSNALQISDHVRSTMADIKKNMPEGADYQ